MINRVLQHNSAGRWIQATGGYQAFVPNSLPPSIAWTPQLVNTLSEADRAIGHLNGLGQGLPDPNLFIRLLQRQEAILSSRIEGIHTALSDLYAYEGAAMISKSLPDDVQEVYNYIKALEYGIQHVGSGVPATLQLVQALHIQLMANIPGKWYRPGEFRTTQNWTGPSGCRLEEATFVPPPPEHLSSVMETWEQFLRRSNSVPPLVQLALIHYQFEAAHPFLDGNGRVGRLLLAMLPVSWTLLSQPLLYLSAYFEQHRQAYDEILMKVSRQGEWETWLLFFLRGIKIRSRITADKGLQLSNLHTHYQEHYATSNKLQSLAKLIFENPLISGAHVVKGLEVSSATAYQYLSLMEKDGILKEVTGRKRGRYYIAHEIMRIIEASAPECTGSQTITPSPMGA
ncbi:MAG: Fic family protein [Anaerolineae bacterium]|nr:Fic family protein [Anaerolineae bacterium]